MPDAADFQRRNNHSDIALPVAHPLHLQHSHDLLKPHTYARFVLLNRPGRQEPLHAPTGTIRYDEVSPRYDEANPRYDEDCPVFAALPCPMPPPDRPWPDPVDSLGLILFVALAIGGPLLGYALLYLDYRKYLSSLRQALVLVRGYSQHLPYWVLRENPPCLLALGLSGSCTREEVLAAYRERVKRLHPDAGGSQQDFARLQRHFEDALQLVAAREAEC